MINYQAENNIDIFTLQIKTLNFKSVCNLAQHEFSVYLLKF